MSSARITHLLLGNVYGFILHDPGHGLRARRRRRRTLVRHVVFGVRQEAPNREPAHGRLVTAESDSLQLVGQHAELGVGEVAQLEWDRNE